MFPDYQNTIENAQGSTIQRETRATPIPSSIGIAALARAGLSVGSWWSEKRDRDLRNFWKKSDHLSGAIYSMTSKMTAITFTIVARDSSNQADVDQAKKLTEILHGAAQFGSGWEVFFSAFVEDLLTQDNGAFAEIIGPGDPSGPLTGTPISVAHLDSARCQRTSNPIYPVLYRDIAGKLYKLHFTRVMYAAQMPSPAREMNGVGFCAVSRCISVAQTLIDILTYKQEKLGSRPHRAILITKGGLDPKDVADAFSMAEQTMDNQGLSRYSKVVVAGSSSMEDAGLQVVELSSLPDGFDERTSVELGMSTIALAFGMDPNELFPNLNASASRADALVQHLKQRGRGPGQILQIVESLFNYKFLPARFQMVFEYQDEAQDRQTAETRRIQTERTNIELINGAMNKRAAREQMLTTGYMDQAQFDMLELSDGRLDDGTDILTTLYKKEPALDPYRDLDVDDPLDWVKNDPKKCALKAHQQILSLRHAIADIAPGDKLSAMRVEALRLLAALIKVKQIYLYILRSGAKDDVGKMIAADEAHAMIDADPELGQDIIAQTQTNQINNGHIAPENGQPLPPDSNAATVSRNMSAKVGPSTAQTGKKPTPGRSFAKVDPAASGFQAQINPRDLTRPRAVDNNPAAKEMEAGEQTNDPF